MASIIEFKRTTQEYSKLSHAKSTEGDHLKAILYAQLAASGGGHSEQIRYVDTLYESGNFERALDLYLGLYFNGYKTREVYYGIISCLYDIGKIKAATYFFKEATKLKVIDENLVDIEEVDYIPMFVSKNPFRKGSVVAAKSIYPAETMLIRGVSSFFDIKKLGENVIKNIQNDYYDEAYSVIMATKLDKKSATKILSMCSVAAMGNYDSPVVYATMVRALCSLDRYEEAEEVALRLKECDMPYDSIELVNCILAFACVNDHEGIAEYAAEMLGYCYTEVMLELCIIANMNIGCYELASELISALLRIRPRHPIALYYSNELRNGKPPYNFKYSHLLGEEPASVNIMKIENILRRITELDGSADEQTLFDWAINYATAATAIVVGGEMIKAGIYPQIITEALCGYSVSIDVKRRLVCDKLLVRPYEGFNLFANKPLRVKLKYMPTVINEITREIYINAYAILACYNGGEGEKKLANYLESNDILHLGEYHLSKDMQSAYLIIKSKVKNLLAVSKVSALLGLTKAESATLKKLLIGGGDNV